MVADGVESLEERLGRELPEGCQFTIHHISSPPNRVSPIFAQAPGQSEDETYYEPHFLSVSITHGSSPLQVFAIEVLVYTTEHLTILFVSKADSTGYLYLLNLPKSVAPPLRTVCTTFLDFLIESRARSDRKLVLSLFARAQDQYLFPGSIENSHKHVLDDRSLIKWWCKAIDPLLDVRPKERAENITQLRGSAYLRVPGCEKYETRGFLPRSENQQQKYEQRWTAGDPLQELARSAEVPERCLIPRFPDDPKARLLLELDDELPESETKIELSAGEKDQHLLSRERLGRWTSVKSLEQFWELMSFRQECAAGRLVGFIWAVFNPKLVQSGTATDQINNQGTLSTSFGTQSEDTQGLPTTGMPPSLGPPTTNIDTPSLSELSLTSPAAASSRSLEVQSAPQLPEQTKNYFWPTWSRGKAVLAISDYESVGDLLLSGDYSGEQIARESTQKLVKKLIEMTAAPVGRVVVGTNERKAIALTPAANKLAPTILTPGLVKKKKKRPAEELSDDVKQERSAPGEESQPESSIWKKAKTDDDTGDAVKPA